MRLPTRIKLLPAIETAGQAGSNLRVAGVEQLDLFGDEGIALGGVEAHEVGAEVAQQGIHLVWIADVESRVSGELLDRGQRS